MGVVAEAEIVSAAQVQLIAGAKAVTADTVGVNAVIVAPPLTSYITGALSITGLPNIFNLLVTVAETGNSYVAQPVVLYCLFILATIEPFVLPPVYGVF